MGFAADLAKLCGAAGDKAELVVRKVALELGGQMIDRSPVDTGRFKSNFMTEVGSSPNTSTTTTAEKSGARSRAQLSEKVGGWKPGQTIWIVNNLPYAYRIEYKGWSKQAPGVGRREPHSDFEPDASHRIRHA